MISWFRVDNRLVHGQVIEAWLPYLDAGALAVVNDDLAEDDLRQQIMKLAIPAHVAVHFIAVPGARALYEQLEKNVRAALFLMANCEDALRLVEQGVPVSVLNVGNMHYAEGKRQICAHVAVSEEDARCLTVLRQKGIRLDFRCVPGDAPVVEGW